MKRTLIRLLAVAVVGGMLLSGCVAAPPEPPPEAPDTAPETTPDGTPTPVPPNPDRVFISYSRCGLGGLDDLFDRLNILHSGRCELRRTGIEQEFTIPPSQLEHLKELIEEAKFLDLKVPDLPQPGADVTRDTIYYSPEEGKMNTVRVWTTAIPDALRPIVYILRQLVDQNSALISYECSGGIAGLHDQLTIYPNGCCELQRELPGRRGYRAFTIQPSQLEHLKELMEDPDFLGLKETYGSPGADLVEYTITYYPEEGQVKTVSAWTTAIPDALQPILNELDQLIDQKSVLIISYERSGTGSLAGLHDQLTILANGHCQLQRACIEREFAIPPSKLERLEELMEEINFLDLKALDLPPPIPDSFEYVISYYPEEGKMNTVRAWTTHATHIPAPLQSIIKSLDGLIAQNSVLISYERSIAFVNLHDVLNIYPNGCCELYDEPPGECVYRAFTITPSHLEHLEELMEEANFLYLKLDTSQPPQPPIPDAGESSITYYPEEGKSRTVSTPGGYESPDALEPIFHELSQIKKLAVITGSQEMATWEMDFADFIYIDVGSGFDVDITQSDSYSVTITANENLFDYFNIRQYEETLIIGLKRASYVNTRLEATITLPELHDLDLGGASRGRISGFSSTNPLYLSSSGASFLEIEAVKAGDTVFRLFDASQITGSIETANCSFEIRGNSVTELTGSGNDANILARSGSSVGLADFPINNAEVELVGVDDATITLSGRLDVNLYRASTLYYSGNPTLGNINMSDDSRIIKL